MRVRVRTFSSMESAVTRRKTLTSFFWPIRCARSCACRSAWLGLGLGLGLGGLGLGLGGLGLGLGLGLGQGLARTALAHRAARPRAAALLEMHAQPLELLPIECAWALGRLFGRELG